MKIIRKLYLPILFLLFLCITNLVFVKLCYAPVSNAPGVDLKDEGVKKGRVLEINAVGAGVTATRSGSTGILTIAGGGAPTDADYLVGTANGSLSAEIVVGTTPGGELGNTWASPTIDDSVTVATWTFNGATVAAGYGLAFGTTDTIKFSEEQTPDAVMILPDNTVNNNIIIAEYADRTFDFAHALSSTPTLFIHGSNQSTTQWISFTHNNTNGVIDVGTGVVSIPDGITSAGTIEGATITEGGTGVVNLGEIDTFAELDAIVADASLEKVVTAGRSLTKTVQDILADAELYTFAKTLYIEDPVAADDLQTIWVAPLACTITKIHYESDQTVVFDLSNDDGTPTGVNGSDITCTTFATDSTLAGDTAMAAGDRMDLAITSVSGTPTWFSVTWEGTYDD